MTRLDSISAAVKVVIDNYPLGYEFYGNQLKDDCVLLYPESQYAYVDTFLKMARRHRRDSYISIDRNNSLYRRVESEFERELRFMRELENQDVQLSFTF